MPSVGGNEDDVGADRETLDAAWVSTNRGASSRLIFDEAMRQRGLQDGRFADMRKRSIELVTFLGGASTLALGWAVRRQDVSQWATSVAAVALAVMVVAAIGTQLPRGYSDGPNIDQLVERQFNEAHEEHLVRRDLAVYYSRILDRNEKAIRWAARCLRVELVSAATAVVAIVLGAAL